MPAEWYPHECTWMAWPSASYTLGTSESDRREARETWANVANAIVGFEPVRMLANPEDHTIARTFLDPAVEIVPMPLNDAWMRDIGPTFVFDQKQELVGVDWIFNGWGEQPWAEWDLDSKVAEKTIAIAAKRRIPSSLVNEGGGFHVNGVGTVLLTETVQLGQGRNPHLTKTEVESELLNTIGASSAIWLKRGLTRDYDEYGTRGHVDIVACFSDENTILYHDQQNPKHPDFEISQEVRETLQNETDFRLIPVPAPKVLRDAHGFVDYSYINHYVCNGGVILCAFNDENDVVAKSIIESAYPNREVVLIKSTALFERGGGIHCITQQQPKELL